MTSRLAPVFLAAFVFASALAAPTPAGAAEPPPPPASAATATAAKEPAAMPDAELEKILTPLLGDDLDARKEAAKTAAALGPEATAAITKKLAELRKTSAASVAGAVKAAGKGDPTDLADALVQTKGDGGGWRTAVSTAVLLKALAHAATTPALRQMVKVAGDHNGAFRPEIARRIKSLGDKAVPALIESRKEASEVRHWAVSQLEGLGKRIPGDAVQTKDNQVLADVLHAFADVHDMDALPVILSFVNSDRIQIRAAARDALALFGQDAVWKLREAYANVTGKPAPEGLPAADIRKQLFAAYDKLRLQEVYGLLEEGLKQAQEGKHEEAVAAFDKVLARQPLIERRGEMVPAYFLLGQKLIESDPPRALALLRKAARLDPEHPRKNQIQAEIAYLEGKDLLARGIADTEPFQRALTLDPTHTGARSELNRLENNIEERQGKLRALAAAGAVLLVALAGILLFGGRRRPRPARI